jgi:hypothetical protein
MITDHIHAGISGIPERTAKSRNASKDRMNATSAIKAVIISAHRRRVGHATTSWSHGCGGVESAGICLTATTVRDDHGVVVRRSQRWLTGGLIVAEIGGG